MPLLTDFTWQELYTPDDENLLEQFYNPALSTACHYDRSAGYFSPDILTAASTAIENIVRNNGQMRLIVGSTLDQAAVEAILRGEKELTDLLAQNMLDTIPDEIPNPIIHDALELLSWMVAHKILEIKVSIPCDANRMPSIHGQIFHCKSGIIQDCAGNSIAFTGSLNETPNGWMHNWESFHVYTSWTNSKNHLMAEESTFQNLWYDNAKRVHVLPLPEAVAAKLLSYLPANDARPKRLLCLEPEEVVEQEIDAPIELSEYQNTWQQIRTAPQTDAYVGLATAAVTPWPHQLRAFLRMYENWPPKLLIADEVGLGKTIQAGLLLRQAILSGRAKRVLIITPPPVMKQWQLELHEKFNLNVPIYDDGKLSWYKMPYFAGVYQKAIAQDQWWHEPIVIASAALLSRKDRQEQLLKNAPNWDLTILEEAHQLVGSNRFIEKGEILSLDTHLIMLS